jgi:hypothetical protein
MSSQDPKSHSGAAIVASIAAAVISGVFAIVATVINVDAKHERERMEQRIEAMQGELKAKDSEIQQLRRQRDASVENGAGQGARRVRQPEQGASLDREQTKIEGGAPPVSEFFPDQGANGFRFTYRGCSPEGADLRCRILVTNTREARKLMISNDSRLVGTDARAFQPRRLINETGQAYSTAIWMELPTGTPLEFALLFSGLANSFREASLLEVHSKEFTVSWTKPPIG